MSVELPPESEVYPEGFITTKLYWRTFRAWVDRQVDLHEQFQLSDEFQAAMDLWRKTDVS